VKHVAPPDPLYRFCDIKEHAQQLCEGYVYLSAFEYIRKCDRLRADEAEGVTQFKTSDAEWLDGVPMNDAAKNIDASGLRGFVPPAKYTNMSGNTFHFRVPDALVLCVTASPGDETFRRVFGEHRVSISRPSDFYVAVSKALQDHVDAPDGFFGPMQYVGRQFSADQTANMEPARVGPEVNAWEQESRMVWYPKDPSAVKPLLLHVPDVVGLCKLD
jgi:hypothetical protein